MRVGHIPVQIGENGGGPHQQAPAHPLGDDVARVDQPAHRSGRNTAELTGGLREVPQQGVGHGVHSRSPCRPRAGTGGSRAPVARCPRARSPRSQSMIAFMAHTRSTGCREPPLGADGCGARAPSAEDAAAGCSPARSDPRGWAGGPSPRVGRRAQRRRRMEVPEREPADRRGRTRTARPRSFSGAGARPPAAGPGGVSMRSHSRVSVTGWAALPRLRTGCRHRSPRAPAADRSRGLAHGPGGSRSRRSLVGGPSPSERPAPPPPA